jgi:hypothetical protein
LCNNFRKKGFGYIMGNFFTNASGHPGHHQGDQIWCFFAHGATIRFGSVLKFLGRTCDDHFYFDENGSGYILVDFSPTKSPWPPNGDKYYKFSKPEKLSGRNLKAVASSTVLPVYKIFLSNFWLSS